LEKVNRQYQPAPHRHAFEGLLHEWIVAVDARAQSVEPVQRCHGVHRVTACQQEVQFEFEGQDQGRAVQLVGRFGLPQARLHLPEPIALVVKLS